MDSQDYLDQISAGVRPAGPKTGLMKIISSKYFKWGMIALAVLIVIIIFGSILGNKPSMKNKCFSFNLHLAGDIEMIDTYQPSVKSSKLRSLSASLRGILSNTYSQLDAYIAQVFAIDDKVIEKSKELQNSMNDAALYKAELNNDLFAAKINGLLDRTYAHKMALEIYSIMSEETGIINTADDANLKSILSSNQDSLENLYSEFSNFSETK
ncbi:hypothetical protein IKF84_01850 [Candidatus Saccharibacteria bacterium]|nr:hypothetical protein [Candidatus Saccharibacteria bacterium]